MESKQINILLIEGNPADAGIIQEILSEVRGLCFYLEWNNRISTSPAAL